MQTFKNTKRSQKGNVQRTKEKPIEPYALFTGNKIPIFAIYYNTAQGGTMDKLIMHLESNPPNKFDIENLHDATYAYLKNYLWRGYSDEKNSEGSILTDRDKKTIIELYQKLSEIRNFHSHYWHDNNALVVSTHLVRFVENCYEEAIAKVQQLDGVSPDAFLQEIKKNNKLKLFSLHDGKFFITMDGRLFFLSFFLYKGDMESLMQQMKGSKGNFNPEHRFKRKLYTYFCHREGSALSTANYSEDKLELFTEEEKNKYNNGQKAYKLLNYLKDAPDYLRDETLPLRLGDGSEVNSLDTLLKFIASKDLLPELNFKPISYEVLRKNAKTISDKKEREAEEKSIEDKERTGFMIIEIKENARFDIEISYNSLYAIIKDIWLFSEKKDIFLYSLDSIVKRRLFIYDILNKDIDKQLLKKDIDNTIPLEFFYPNERPNNEVVYYYTLQQLASFPIGATPKLAKKLEAWHQKMENGRDENDMRKRILNLLRPNDVSHLHYYSMKGQKSLYKDHVHAKNNEPIVYHLSEYYKGEPYKPRKENKFLSWAAGYLMDKKLTPDIEWAFEKKTTEAETKDGVETYRTHQTIVYAHQIPHEHRVKLINNNLLFRVTKTSDSALDSDSNYLYYYLGEKAMMYLLYWHFEKKDGENSINDLFAKVLSNDILKLRATIENQQAIDFSILDFLEPYAIPECMKSEASERDTMDNKAIIEKIISKKIKYLEADIQAIEANQYNRSEQNRTLLKAYQLFDFSQTMDGKFLRKNEYELMSVVHYMLNRKKINENFSIKPYLTEKFKVNDRTLIQRLPDDIVSMLLQAKSLPDACLTILQNRKELLENIQNQLPNLKTSMLTKQYPILKQWLGDEESDSGFAKSFPRLPFAVHPSLIHKYFDKERYRNGEYLPDQKNKDKKYLNPLARTRHVDNHNPIFAFKRILFKAFYDTSWVSQYASNEEDRKKGQKIIGKMTETHNRDILLACIAEQYLISYDQALAKNLKEKNQTFDIHSLFGNQIIKPIIPEVLNKDTEDEEKLVDTYYLSIKLHQTDDRFYKTYQPMLARLLRHYILRRREELDYYAHKDKALADKVAINMPDGRSEDNAIPLGILIQEKKIIGQEGLRVLDYVFAFEKKTLESWLEKEGARDNQSRQKKMEEEAQQRPYIKFGEVCAKRNDFESQKLQKLRNDILHSAIPAMPYRVQCAPQMELADLLGIQERIARDKTILSPYDASNPPSTE